MNEQDVTILPEMLELAQYLSGLAGRKVSGTIVLDMVDGKIGNRLTVHQRSVIWRKCPVHITGAGSRNDRPR